MRTHLLFVLFLFVPLLTKAQVWAPSGATWHYDWVEMATDGYAKIVLTPYKLDIFFKKV